MIFNFKLKNQINSFSANGNETFSTIDDDGVKKKQAKEIVVGDLLVGKNKYLDYLNLPFFINYHSKDFSFKGNSTLELVEFIGFFVSSNPYVVDDKIIIKNPKSVDFFYSFFSKFFDNKTLSFSLFDNNLIIHANSSIINFFYYLGVNFENHCVPFFIKSSSNEYASRFLTGFIENKFKFELDKTYYFKIPDLSKKIASDLQHLFDLFGVYSIAEEDNVSYCLKIGGFSNLNRFLNCVNLKINHNLEIIKNNSYLKTGIQSEKLHKLVFKNTPIDLVDNFSFCQNKIFDINDIEEFLNFEEKRGNGFFNHMHDILDNPIYFVEEINCHQETSTDLKDDTYFFTYNLESAN